MQVASGGARRDAKPRRPTRDERLVHVERLGDVPLRLECLHEQPIAALAIGCELHERPIRALRRIELGPAEAQPARGDALVGPATARPRARGRSRRSTRPRNRAGRSGWSREARPSPGHDPRRELEQLFAPTASETQAQADKTIKEIDTFVDTESNDPLALLSQGTLYFYDPARGKWIFGPFRVPHPSR